MYMPLGVDVVALELSKSLIRSSPNEDGDGVRTLGVVNMLNGSSDAKFGGAKFNGAKFDGITGPGSAEKSIRTSGCPCVLSVLAASKETVFFLLLGFFAINSLKDDTPLFSETADGAGTKDAVKSISIRSGSTVLSVDELLKLFVETLTGGSDCGGSKGAEVLLPNDSELLGVDILLDIDELLNDPI
jgi:hypothetical protein